MTYTLRAVRVFLFVMVSMLVSSSVLADEKDDVMSVVQEWADLESDLTAQAGLVRDDRIQIFNMLRQTNQATNLKSQLMRWAALKKRDPDFQLLTYLESPIVRVYGDAAIVNFVRVTRAIPGNANSSPPFQAFITLVLIKESGDWRIAHMHGSTAPN